MIVENTLSNTRPETSTAKSATTRSEWWKRAIKIQHQKLCREQKKAVNSREFEDEEDFSFFVRVYSFESKICSHILFLSSDSWTKAPKGDARLCHRWIMKNTSLISSRSSKGVKQSFKNHISHLPIWYDVVWWKFSATFFFGSFYYSFFLCSDSEWEFRRRRQRRWRIALGHWVSCFR